MNPDPNQPVSMSPGRWSPPDPDEPACDLCGAPMLPERDSTRCSPCGRMVRSLALCEPVPLPR
jgi:hypothetical protein